MAILEEITVGSTVKGIINDETVTIVSVQWFGSNVIDVTYRDNKGKAGTQLVLRDNEESIEVMSNHLPWSFDADGAKMKLAAEAYRISLLIFSILILQFIRHLLSRCRIRSLQYIRRCYLNFL